MPTSDPSFDPASYLTRTGGDRLEARLREDLQKFAQAERDHTESELKALRAQTETEHAAFWRAIHTAEQWRLELKSDTEKGTVESRTRTDRDIAALRDQLVERISGIESSLSERITGSLTGLNEQVLSLQKEVTELRKFRDQTEGKVSGANTLWILLAGGIATIGIVIGTVLNLSG